MTTSQPLVPDGGTGNGLTLVPTKDSQIYLRQTTAHGEHPGHPSVMASMSGSVYVYS